MFLVSLSKIVFDLIANVLYQLRDLMNAVCYVKNNCY